MLRAVSGLSEPLTAGFELGFVDAGGAEVRRSLIDSAELRFELFKPVRGFPSYKRHRNFPGLWWSSTVGSHVGFESWLERNHLMLLDFDAVVVGIASKPFRLFWDDEVSGRRRSHAPDYFARLVDGRGLVVDCRPAERIKPRDAVAFAETRRACELAGWEYRLVGVPELVTVRNVRWLAGYRHPRYRLPQVVAALGRVFAEPAPLIDGAAAVGDLIAVLPVLFHLLWRGELTRDPGTRLHEATMVTMAGCADGAAGVACREWVRFDGDEHQVVALAGTSVRLRSRGGAAQVVLLAFLLAAADFELLDEQQSVPSVEPFGLLETLPSEVLSRPAAGAAHRRGGYRRAAGPAGGQSAAAGIRRGGQHGEGP